MKRQKPVSNDPSLFGLEPRADPFAAKKPKGDRVEQLEYALERALKRARAWEMAFIGLHRQNIRLVAMLLDLKVPAEKLGEYQKALDHIEAIKMNGMSHMKSVALEAATDLGDVQRVRRGASDVTRRDRASELEAKWQRARSLCHCVSGIEARSW
jgi:hypothetical protein